VFGRLEPGTNVRKATIVCNVTSEFLVLDIGKPCLMKDRFNKIMLDQDTSEEYNERLNYLHNISLYKDHEIAAEAAKSFNIRYFDKGDVIAQEGKSNKYLNFIVNGQISVDKQIPFVRRTLSMGRTRVKPDNGRPLGEGEERFIQYLP
jgi:hypothetical protein